ncbi:MAG TPA: isoprenylcysteine carboxylmethyltransferase family protein [Rhizomicrobium sp.]|nr:isoprenylcysteine carboxylmethyltransferase family protein [Rhizomicrobium sp.]
MRDYRDTKLYDLASASPLILWYAFAVAGLWPQIVHALRAGLATHNSGLLLEGLSLLTSAGFIAFEILVFFLRETPVRFSESWLSRGISLAAANLGIAFLMLPRAQLSSTAAVISSALIISGSAMAILVLCWLRRSFSILPQARRLITTGPYRYVRHPLYLAEAIAGLGLMMQFRQPWAGLMAVMVFALQFPRMRYEETVLAKAFPSYHAYSARTARLLPGIY